tara:strand:+ start:56 stop:376 length:321 start_codon:yes stop_codon:yes gene_type:complete
MADYTDFKRLGHPGKYRGIISCAKNSTTNFTGSNYGAAALFFQNDAGFHSGTTITFSDGSSITADKLGNTFASGSNILEASISKVVVQNTNNCDVHVLLKNAQYSG